jgi:hypothetical protein
VRVSPETLFQAGWTLLFGVGRKARRAHRRAGGERGYALFGTPTDEALHAGALLRPLWAEALDDEHRLGHRPVESLDELSRLEARVDFATTLLDTFETRFGLTIDALENAELLGLGVDTRRRIRLTTLVRTGLLHSVISGEFKFSAVKRELLSQFARVAFDKTGKLSEAITRQVNRLCDTVKGNRDALAELLERALTELEGAMGGVAETDLDLRYAGELFLVAD